MKPFEVGEVGIIQNVEDATFLNGMIAEVIAKLDMYPVRANGIKEGGEDKVIYKEGYYVKILIIRVPYPDHEWFAHPHNLRRITDPDAEQKTEKEVGVQS